LRFVHNGISFNGPTISQNYTSHKFHSINDPIRQKRTYHSIDAAANPPPQKRAHTNSGQQSNERASQHTLGLSEQPLPVEEIHPSHAASQSCDGQQTGSPLCQSDCVGSRDDSLTPAGKSGESSSQQTLRSHTDEIATHFTPISCPSDCPTGSIITQEQIDKVRAENEKLKIANARKQKEMLASLALSWLINHWLIEYRTCKDACKRYRIIGDKSTSLKSNRRKKRGLKWRSWIRR
jgi:hypothetical protein